MFLEEFSHCEKVDVKGARVEGWIYDGVVAVHGTFEDVWLGHEADTMPDAQAQRWQLHFYRFGVFEQDAHMSTQVCPVVPALIRCGGRAPFHAFSSVQTQPKCRSVEACILQTDNGLAVSKWTKGKSVFLAHAIKPDDVILVEGCFWVGSSRELVCKQLKSVDRVGKQLRQNFFLVVFVQWPTSSHQPTPKCDVIVVARFKLKFEYAVQVCVLCLRSRKTGKKTVFEAAPS